MATQEIVKTIWKNWCALSPENRERVADHLGAVGKLLSIAANVQSIANTAENRAQNAPQDAKTQNAKDAKTANEDDDVIDAEFEEV